MKKKSETSAKVDVSVLICVKNTEKFIQRCLASLLLQTYDDFEIVIIEEFDSNDRTQEIIRSFNDKRIRYFKNPIRLGITKSRNRSIMKARGQYLFFTDGDCIVSNDWIEEGLKTLKSPGYVGVEGKTYNVSEDYKPTFSDHSYNMRRGEMMTNNIAYKRSIVEYVGGFDGRYSFHEDRDLGLRIKRVAKIGYNPLMKVYVQHQTFTYRDLLRRTDALKNKAYLFKRFGDCHSISGRIIEPWGLLKMIFPALIFISLLSNKYVKTEDFKLFPFQYVNLVISRLKLWRESAKERIFLI